jgi:choice-of-anchor B domain-containing protein
VKSILIAILYLLTFNCISQTSYNVELLDTWTDTTRFKGAEDAIFSDVWGFTTNQNNYVALGSTEGTHILEIVDGKLIERDFKAGKFSSAQVQHRDYKTYKNYLYAVCDEGPSSLQIFDLSYLPDSIHTVYDSDIYFQICHNLFIDTNTAKLYACGTNNSGMTIFDISNPTQPQLLYDFNDVNYVHDCYVTNDTAFLNCGINGLYIYDFSSIPVMQLGIMDFYAEQGYNHSGWLSENKKKYVFIDETKGKKVKICNSQSLINIEVEAIYGTKDYENHVAHNIQIYSDFAFISYYNEGLRIVDIMENKPKEIGFFDSFPQETNYKLNGAWGIYVFKNEELVLVSDRQNGLFLLHFPIQLYRNSQGSSNTSTTPFINKESVIIYPSASTDNLNFTIYDSKGNTVYSEQAIKDWINIPLNLASGAYLYNVSNLDFVIISQGKFTVIN